MTPTQALQVLQQVLVTKIGLATQDIQLVLQAWAVLDKLVKDNTPQKMVTLPPDDLPVEDKPNSG